MAKKRTSKKRSYTRATQTRPKKRRAASKQKAKSKRHKPGHSRIQSLMFYKHHTAAYKTGPLFTIARAKAWARKHKFKYSKVDDKPNTIRLRQFSPEGKKIVGMYQLRPGIKGIVAL